MIGSEAIGKGVVETLKKYPKSPAVLMQNHGPFTIGKAKILKANPDKKYKVAGYADKATGSASWNQKLSEKRAQVVYDALIAQGVDKDQLELVGFGGTENMFGKNFLNRVVILE